jgi:hypothetical protein
VLEKESVYSAKVTSSDVKIAKLIGKRCSVSCFRTSSQAEKRKAVVKELRSNEDQKRRVSMVQCSVQGQCMRWESIVVERKIS